MSDQDAQAHVGELVLTQFLIERLVGEGSFAWVYRARGRSGHKVAIKVLHAREESAELRFEREIRVLRALPASPHVAGYIDHGHAHSGSPLLVLDYVDGITLGEGMERRQKLAPEKAVALVAQLCEAFVGLHQLGVAHRDVKPENILLGRDGSVKLIDFGLIRDAQGILQLLEGEEESLGGRVFSHELDTGVLAGTPEYMAPEQFSDSAADDAAEGRTDTSSDVFSLGVILYQLLSGMKPFPMGEVNRRTYHRQLLRYFRYRIRLTDEDVPTVGHVDAALDSIMRKALRTDPRRRQPDARALMEDLRRYERTGMGVLDIDESLTVSVAVESILPVSQPKEQVEEVGGYDGEADMFAEAGRPVAYSLLDDDDDNEVTAVRHPPTSPQPPPAELEEPQQEEVYPEASPHPASPFDVEDFDPEQTAIEPGESPPQEPYRRRRKGTPFRNRASRKRVKDLSIFDQDTREVNVAEIMPHEVKDPHGRDR